MFDKTHRECMAEILGVLKRYDMAGAITVISKERAAFRYHMPTWSVVKLEEGPDGGLVVRVRSKKEDFPSREAQHTANELSAHIIFQMRDIANNTLGMCNAVIAKMRSVWDIEHTPHQDFDPERNN